MPDQTRRDWIPSNITEVGTLVLVSANESVPQLLPMFVNFAAPSSFNFSDDPVTKFYFSNVPYVFVAESGARLSAYSYAWIPKGIRDFFIGKCGGEDCTESKVCVRPGCICTPKILSNGRTCR